MLLTEYNETETMELFKEEGRAEGRVEGSIETRAEDIRIFSEVFHFPIDQVEAALRERSVQYQADV